MGKLDQLLLSVMSKSLLFLFLLFLDIGFPRRCEISPLIIPDTRKVINRKVETDIFAIFFRFFKAFIIFSLNLK